MTKILAALVLMSFVSGCASASAPKISFCTAAKPIILKQSDVAKLSDSAALQILAQLVWEVRAMVYVDLKTLAVIAAFIATIGGGFYWGGTMLTDISELKEQLSPQQDMSSRIVALEVEIKNISKAVGRIEGKLNRRCKVAKKTCVRLTD